MSVSSRTVATAFIVFAIGVVTPRVAAADKVDGLIRQLTSSSDYKVRLSAALNLAKLDDRRAVPALIRALGGDSDKTVRGVAAASIGKLVDGNSRAVIRNQAIAALRRASTSDKNAFVRRQAKKAYESVKKVGSGGGSGGGGKVYVNIGPMSAEVSSASKVRAMMRKTAQGVFRKKASSMMTSWPGGKSPSKRDIKSRGVSAFYVDGTLQKLDVVRKGSSSVVSCKLSMLLATYPEKSMFGFASGGAKVQSGTSNRDVEYAKEDCVAAVVESLVAKKIIPTIKSRVP